VALIFLLSVELASAVTMTTRTEAMMAVLVRLLGPLRALGVDPERPALMVTLMIRAIPVVLGFSEDIRQALYARNARHTPTTLAVPLMIRSLRYADAMAEALDARGFADGAR
jgi:biotin transport system permease protein